MVEFNYERVREFDAFTAADSNEEIERGWYYTQEDLDAGMVSEQLARLAELMETWLKIHEETMEYGKTHTEFESQEYFKHSRYSWNVQEDIKGQEQALKKWETKIAKLKSLRPCHIKITEQVLPTGPKASTFKWVITSFEGQLI